MRIVGPNLLLLAIPLILAASPIRADDIFTWTDADGRTHYSTERTTPDGKPRSLPSIGRENIDKRIEQIRGSTPPSCERHGGVDCSRGADKDGSVICLDGTRDAVLPFRFECLESQLQVDYRVLVQGGDIPHSRNLASSLPGNAAPYGLEVSVRNLSGVEAYGMKVEFLLGRRRRIAASGPERIPPFGSASYTGEFSALPEPPNRTQIEQGTYRITCTNCGTIRSIPR